MTKTNFKTVFKTLTFFIFLISLSLQGQELSKPDYTWARHLKLKKNISYGEEKAKKLDVFFQKDTLLKPTLIYFHGGNWIH